MAEMDENNNGTGMNEMVLSPALLTALFADVLVPVGTAPAPGMPGKTSQPETVKPVAGKGKTMAMPEKTLPAAITPEMPPPEGNPETTSRPAPVLRTLGENRRKICLLVAIPGKEVLPARTRSFLEKMLAACQLTVADLVIVNITLSPAGYGGLSSAFAPEKWLLAGIPPATIGINAPGEPFQVVPWNGGQLLTFPALAEMEPDSAAAKQLKRQLWTGLQKIFGL